MTRMNEEGKHTTAGSIEGRVGREYMGFDNRIGAGNEHM